VAAETALEFGEELRRERELRDVGRDQLAAATKVSMRQIEALETGRFDLLPASVFSRGFVRSISVHLGLDSDRTVSAFRHVYDTWEEENRKRVPLTTTAATIRLSKPRRTVSSDTTVRGLGIAAVLALLTGGAAFLKSHGADSRKTVPASSTVATRPETGPASLALPPAIAAATVALPAQGRASSVTPGAADTKAVSTLTLSFREECWTEVLVDGKVALKELVPKGASREFSGGNTFTLALIGNAGAVDLVLDGRSLLPIGRRGEVVRNVVIEGRHTGSEGRKG
jgi:cytoskeleton protein RodZ